MNDSALILLGGSATAINTGTKQRVAVPREAMGLTFFSTNSIKLQFNPALLDAIFYNPVATSPSGFWRSEGSKSSLTRDLTTGDLSATSGGTLSAASKDAMLYACFSSQITGLYITVALANALSATLTVEFWNGREWDALTVSDGTYNDPATLGQSGFVDWVSGDFSDWRPSSIDPNVTQGLPRDSALGYWLRLSWSANLTAGTAISAIAPYNDNFFNIPGYFMADTQQYLSIIKGQVGAMTFEPLVDSTDVYYSFLCDDNPLTIL